MAIDRTADNLSTFGKRFRTYMNMIFVDHGFVRLLIAKASPITQRAWRSGQPWPYQVKQAKERGIRTILNLRGARDCGSYVLEREACEKYGITLIDMPLDSRGAPQVDRLNRAQEIFSTIEYPVLMHCKSGADRAGIGSALYQMLKEGQTVTQAKSQLSLRYGHVRQAKTGVLDAFLEEYEARNAREPIDFMTWVNTEYDREGLNGKFQHMKSMDILVDFILRRE
ncbi:tyrosine-protein phosphatase [Pyruvatibacter sp. HU-CL02332]|uniref:fused DSP-PTPase phosphatase/NAD kinase-like protein n=1 Tax=Pyruvatibacter sp. HU-CL02332 TaxID=3127650 RepID=UPI00310215B7